MNLWTLDEQMAAVKEAEEQAIQNFKLYQAAHPDSVEGNKYASRAGRLAEAYESLARLKGLEN